jgi:hypothetical protein
VTYTRDVVIDRGRVGKRKKKPSRKFREDFGHTPLSIEEKLPWKCRRLIIGTKLWIPSCNEGGQARGTPPTSRVAKAIIELAKQPEDTNAILHVTC